MPPASGSEESGLIGYWVCNDYEEFEAYHIEANGVATSLSGEYGTPYENEEYTTYWTATHVDEMKIVSVNTSTLILDEHGDGSDIIVYSRISAAQWNNLRRTGTLDGNGGSTPDTPDTPSWSTSDFVGVWLSWTKGAVYELKSNYNLVCYYLTESGSNTYKEKVTGTWSYNSTTQKISFNKSDGSRTEIVTAVNSPWGFRTTDGYWEATQIPTYRDDNPSADNSLLQGTKWQGRVDGDLVTIEFKANGKFTETYDGYSTSDSYQVLDANTLLIGEKTVLSNTFGSIVTFTLNYNKTKITFSNSYDKWELSRIM